MADLIIDGMSMLKTSAGHVSTLDNGAAFSFLRSLKARLDEVLKRKKYCDSVIVCWEGDPTARKKDLPTYKSDRERSSDSINTSKVVLYKILPYLGVTQMRHPDWEADDLVGALTLTDRESVIVSGDKDLIQLVSPTTSLIQKDRSLKKEPKKDSWITLDNFLARTGCPTPEEWILFKAIIGDGSDKIPGLHGVGAKNALKYIFKLPMSDSITKKIDDFIVAEDGLKKILNLTSLPHPNFTTDDIRTINASRDKDKTLILLEEAGFTSLVSGFDKWWVPFTKIG